MSSALFFAVGTIGLSTRGGRKPSTLLGAARRITSEPFKLSEGGDDILTQPAVT